MRPFGDLAVGQKTQQQRCGHRWCFSPMILRKTFKPVIPKTFKLFLTFAVLSQTGDVVIFCSGN